MPKLIDLTGKVFGRLTIVSRADNDKWGEARWLCKCSCGETTIVKGRSLKSGATASYGCYRKEKASSSSLIDLTGKVFGCLTVVSRAESDKRRKARWLCKCSCGKTTIVRGCDLRAGTTVSCGCYKKELTKKRLTTHSKTNTRPYHIWRGMKDRCLNSRAPKFPNYGGRGITVCDEWLDKEKGFQNFYNWAIENGYRDDLSIDRIDNDKGYCPDNCRWSSLQTQSENRRCVKAIKINGIEYPSIAAAARAFGVSSKTLRRRLKKRE